jgi:putative ABC transport system permease protein
MMILSILRVSFIALLRNKVRSLLTTLGIIMGIASVIAMMAMGEGATVMLQDSIRSFGDNLLMIFPGSASTGGMRGGVGTSQTLTLEDGEALMAECPNLRSFTPLLRTGAQVIYQENNWATRVQGVSTSYPQVRTWEVQDGEFFTDSELRAGMRVAVLGMTVVQNLFGGEEPVGQTIRIMNMPFRVEGVMKPKGSNAFGMDQDDTVVIPWTTYRRVLVSSKFNNVDTIMVNLYSMDQLKETKAQIAEILRERHHLGENEDDDLTVTDMTEVTETITKVSVIMTVLLTVIASISLLVGGIGIMNIMLVSVTERTREIGLRMAVGAKSRDILLQFLIESMVLSLVGGGIGIALGTGAAQMLSHSQGWPVLVSIKYVLIAIGFSAGVGIFFGFYPAWRAAKLNPIEALRYE